MVIPFPKFLKYLSPEREKVFRIEFERLKDRTRKILEQNTNWYQLNWVLFSKEGEHYFKHFQGGERKREKKKKEREKEGEEILNR